MAIIFRKQPSENNKSLLFVGFNVNFVVASCLGSHFHSFGKKTNKQETVSIFLVKSPYLHKIKYSAFILDI